MSATLVLDAAMGVARPRTDAELAASIRRWMDEVVVRGHPLLGRPGPICPFVRPAQRAGLVAVEVVRTGPDPDVDDVAAVARRAADRFHLRPHRDADRGLATTVTILADLEPDTWSLVDDAHLAVKDEIVARGLMIGQFHPECPARAAHNAHFPVNRAPMPLYVLRWMAPHDVLFLAERRDWFHEYARRFGHRYASGGHGAGHGSLRDRFHEALGEHGPPPERTTRRPPG